MTREEIERIWNSFVAAEQAECSPEIASLLTVMKFYGVEKTASIAQLNEWSGADKNKFINMEGIKEAAERVGMQTNLDLMDMEMLEKMTLPLILFMWNECGKPMYVVCFGLHEGRYILWDADWGGPMQYWPYEVEALWIKGISMRFFPNDELRRKADCQIKWWQLFSWTKACRYWFIDFREWLSLYVFPLFAR